MITCSAPTVRKGLVIADTSVSPLRLEGTISRGGFSTVYKARNNYNVYAVKRINYKRHFYQLRSRYLKWKNPPKKEGSKEIITQESLNETKKQEIKTEINVLKNAQHKFVLKLFDSFEKKGSVWLVTEYCVCDLSEIYCDEEDFDSVFSPTHIPVQVVVHLLIPVIKAVAHLNTLGYVHLDIKTDNVLISSKGVPKLADFGLARKCTDKPVKLLHTIGTKHYMAPEMIRKDFFNYSIDTWSLAVTMLYALFGPDYIKDESSDKSPSQFFFDVPADGKFDQEKLDAVFSIPKWKDEEFGKVYGNAFLQVLDFIRKIMVFNWKERPTPTEALKLGVGQKVLKDWREQNTSPSFKSRHKLLLKLLEQHIARLPTEKEKREWSTIDVRLKQTSDRCRRFLGGFASP